MSRSRSLPVWIATIAVAAGIGLVLGLLTTVFVDGGPAPPPVPGPSADGPSPDGKRPVDTSVEAAPVAPRDMEAVLQRAGGEAGSLAERFDSDDADVRLATARSLLEEGPSALAQVSALRPRGAEAQQLRADLEDALKDWAVLQRAPASKSEEARLYSKLRLYARVLPPDWMRGERLAYWEAKVAGDVERAASGRARPAGESALARLELGLVRYELGELGRTEFLKLRDADEGAARAWVDGLRGDRAVSSAERRRREEQLARVMR